VDARRHLIGGATNEGGSTIAWVRETFQVPEDAEAQLVTRPADSHGLTFLPFLTGERSPGYRAEASGTLHGLRAATTPLDVLQAAMEGVALRLAAIAENLGRDFGKPGARFRADLCRGRRVTSFVGLGADLCQRARSAAGIAGRSGNDGAGRGPADAGSRQAGGGGRTVAHNAHPA